MTESDEKTTEELDKELEDEEERLRAMPTHGKHMGMVEFQDMAKNHPQLLEFFEKADEVLKLDAEAKERMVYLEKCYLDGDIAEDELKELEENFFNPYYARQQTR